MNPGTLYLCGGLQSSGSTLISWCFLQRTDMDGILDARFDMLPVLSCGKAKSKCWCKFTIACFRFKEVQDYFEDEGLIIRPLLVVRDARAVFDSLIQKAYGRNGITAEDPPLRLRLRRFREDWELFRERSWPMLRYEDLVTDPEATLRAACVGLELPWDEAMTSWPKPPDQISDPGFGNPTFIRSRSTTLFESIKPSLAAISTRHIPVEDLNWIEKEFQEMNRVMGYPISIPATFEGDETTPRAIPTFQTTRRYERQRRKHRLSRSLGAIGKRIAGLIGHRNGLAQPTATIPAANKAASAK